MRTFHHNDTALKKWVVLDWGLKNYAGILSAKKVNGFLSYSPRMDFNPVFFKSYRIKKSTDDLAGIVTMAGAAFGPGIAGYIFDINQSCRPAFVIFAVMRAAGALFIRFAKPPKPDWSPSILLEF